MGAITGQKYNDWFSQRLGMPWRMEPVETEGRPLYGHYPGERITKEDVKDAVREVLAEYSFIHVGRQYLYDDYDKLTKEFDQKLKRAKK